MLIPRGHQYNPPRNPCDSRVCLVSSQRLCVTDHSFLGVHLWLRWLERWPGLPGVWVPHWSEGCGFESHDWTEVFNIWWRCKNDPVYMRWVGTNVWVWGNAVNCNNPPHNSCDSGVCLVSSQRFCVTDHSF